MILNEKEALDMVEKYNKEGDGWFLLTKCYFLTESFMEKYKDKLNWYDIFRFNYELSEKFKEKFKDFNTLDNRDIRFCHWCGNKNKFCDYRRDGKLIKSINTVIYDYYYCPNCLR